MSVQQPLTRALALALCMANSTAMSLETVTMKPFMATSYASGSKHILSFFVSDKGVCNLTLMVSELANDDPQSTGSRMLIAIDPQQSSRLDISDGKSLEFQCGKSASTMAVLSVDRIAYLEKQ